MKPVMWDMAQKSFISIIVLTLLLLLVLHFVSGANAPCAGSCATPAPTP